MTVAIGGSPVIRVRGVVASFAGTEDAANGITSVVQFPMMFLSGTFFRSTRCRTSSRASRGSSRSRTCRMRFAR